MGSWIGSWLAGEAPDDVSASAGSRQVQQQYRGERLGLPESGAGSVASIGRRLAALLVDCVLASLITSLFLPINLMNEHTMLLHNYWSVLVWYVVTVVGTAFFGFSPGMALLGIRVARIDGSAMVGPWRALVRAACVVVIIPAAVWDADYRGLHDRLVGTIMVAMR